MATLWKCVAEPSGNPLGPPHAAGSTPHALRMPAKTSLAGDNKNSSGDEIANVNFFYNIAHVEASAYTLKIWNT